MLMISIRVIKNNKKDIDYSDFSLEKNKHIKEHIRNKECKETLKNTKNVMKH